jgi:hypothetical protein
MQKNQVVKLYWLDHQKTVQQMDNVANNVKLYLTDTWSIDEAELKQ